MYPLPPPPPVMSLDICSFSVVKLQKSLMASFALSILIFQCYFMQLILFCSSFIGFGFLTLNDFLLILHYVKIV